MNRPTCRTCPYYDPNYAVFSAFMKRESAGMKGACRHDPRDFHKKPDDWCGQHPDFPDYVRAFTMHKWAQAHRPTTDQEDQP